MKTQLKADIMLLIVTLGWGVSYYLMDIALGDVDTFTLNAYRFLGAFFIAAVLTFPKIRTVNRETLKYSLLVGTALVFVYTGATFGVKYTTLSNSGFLCALTVLFVPVFEFFLFRKKPQKKIVLAVTVSLIGIMLLTLQSDLSINMDNLKGDLMCVMCAVAYALDLIITGKAVEKPEVNAYQLGVFQLGISYILYVESSKYCPPLACCLLGAAEPLLNPVWVLIFDGERPGVFALIGGVIVVVSITLWCVFGQEKPEESPRTSGELGLHN